MILNCFLPVCNMNKFNLQTMYIFYYVYYRIHIHSKLLIQEVAFTCKVLLRWMKQNTQNPYRIINIHSNGSQKNRKPIQRFPGQTNRLDTSQTPLPRNNSPTPCNRWYNGSGHPLVSSRCEHRVIMLTPVCKNYNCSATRIVVTFRNGCVYMQ